MLLRYLVPNMRWVFIFGDSIVTIYDEDRFFVTRRDAVAAARRGLVIRKNNTIG